MRSVNILGLVFLSAALLAADLPSRERVKVTETSPLAFGKYITFNIEVDLPMGQKLNLAASSEVHIYERLNDGWIQRERFMLNDYVKFPGLMEKIERTLSLMRPDSELAVDAVVYHCSIKKGAGPCYIDRFQKRLQRNGTDRSLASIKLKPTKEY